MTHSPGHDPRRKPQWQNLFVEPSWPLPVEVALPGEEAEAVRSGMVAAPHRAPRERVRRGAM
ncbi:hypothetical protein [Streptomyces sp. SPB074]|uniref:hypothetical protein n=1 Tax=Streptomyces sp. (strain SPB074) TaxID=465543 RepID=UPI00017F1CA9|nr:hypothetical protein [Streptomyces sp. SPB074]EDY42669.1 hypothetical protein SSBG_00631 [Streptomyces sp. SPB074]